MLVFEGVIRLISWNRQDQRIDHMTIMATASRCRNFADGTYLFYLACFVGVLLTCIMWLLSKNYLLRWCHTLHGLRWVTQTLDASGSLYLFTHGRFLRFWIWQSTSADDHLVGKASIYHLTTYPRNMRYFSMFILQQELMQIVRFTSPGEACNINKNAQVLMSHTNWHFCAGPKYPIITHYISCIWGFFIFRAPPCHPKGCPTPHLLVVIVFSAVLASFFDRLEFATSDRWRQRRSISTSTVVEQSSSPPVGWVLQPPFRKLGEASVLCENSCTYITYICFFVSETNGGTNPPFCWGGWTNYCIYFGFPFS